MFSLEIFKKKKKKLIRLRRLLIFFIEDKFCEEVAAWRGEGAGDSFSPHSAAEQPSENAWPLWASVSSFLKNLGNSLQSCDSKKAAKSLL